MTVKTVPTSRMRRNKIIRRLDGSFVEFIKDGKTLVKRGDIVDQEGYQEFLQEQKDRMEAAKAPTMERKDANAPDRTVNPQRLEELEAKLKDQDKKLDAILAALKK